jgi:hypothetical protein
MQHPAHLAHPVVHEDFGTPQAQRRFAAHRHHVLTQPALLATVFDLVSGHIF